MSQETHTSNQKAMQDKLAQLNSKKVDFWKPPVGETVVRILPHMPGQENFWHDSRVHYIGKNPFQCDRQTEDDTCLACSYSDKMMASDDAVRRAKGAKMQSQVQTMANIAVDHGSPKAKNFIWTLPDSVMQQLISAYFGDYPGLDHPVTGHDFVLTRVGVGLPTRYTVMPRKNSSATTKSLMRGRKDLSKISKASSEDDVRRAVSAFIKSSDPVN